MKDREYQYRNPMKPVETIDGYYECPMCSRSATDNVVSGKTQFHEFCPGCGQKLDWEFLRNAGGSMTLSELIEYYSSELEKSEMAPSTRQLVTDTLRELVRAERFDGEVDYLSAYKDMLQAELKTSEDALELYRKENEKLLKIMSDSSWHRKSVKLGW